MSKPRRTGSTEKAATVGPVGLAVAQRVRAFREGAQLTLAALSDEMETGGHSLNVPALSRIESGLRRIDVDDLTGICSALGLSPNDVLGYESQPASGLSINVAPQWLDKFLQTATALQELYKKGPADGDD